MRLEAVQSKPIQEALKVRTRDRAPVSNGLYQKQSRLRLGEAGRTGNRNGAARSGGRRPYKEVFDRANPRTSAARLGQ